MARKRKHSRKKPQSPGEKLAGRIFYLLQKNPRSTFTPKQIARKLDFQGKRRFDNVLDALLNLERTGQAKQVAPEVFKLYQETEHVVTGRVDHVNARYAFLITDELEEDIKLSSDDLNGALHDDIVRVGIFEGRQGLRPEGEVIDVVERGKKELVGVVDKSSKHMFVIPDGKRFHQDIFISQKENEKKAFDGDKVIVKILRWPEDGKKAEGIITKVLGEAGTHNVEMNSIMLEYGLPDEFSKKVEKEANAIPTEITDIDIKSRKDFRKVTTFTIDPFDAKDFDDALSFKNLGEGVYEIGVHIADVTHYVQDFTELEKEAFERATSVYLVDRVIPMLPENLSNALCSLRPNEDKLCFSAVFEINSDGQVLKEWFGRTVIHSDRRFTYEEAQEILEGKDGDYAEEILTLNKLAYKLREKRFKEGSISFETPEVKFKLDSDGTPIAVIPKIRKDAHKLIEDFMLLANKQVAEFIFKKSSANKQKPFIYRVHENPDFTKLENFANFAKRFGHQLAFSQNNVADTLNSLTGEIEGKPEENVLQSLAIRAMAKARYTTEPLGHFGLGFDHYSHFTSPIRRYPDMMVHRLLQHYLDKGEGVNKEEYEEKCLHSSEQEKRASDAERESIKYKQVEYMSLAENKVWDGIVSGITDFGIFVELIETKCEGMIRVASLTDDYYEYDADNFQIVGKRNKRIISFGDQLTVRVTGTDLRTRTIDLELVEIH